jgi:ornithine cyclodeaminase/alanine dehydrogenase-like protein (mu-crystallin family)
MTDVLSEILRVHSEPCTYVNESAVHRSLVAAPGDYLAVVSKWLTMLANNRATMELPAKWICTDTPSPDSGDFRVMPCVVRWGAEVIKTVKIVGTNRRQQLVPDQITVGKAVRIHPEENFITHVFEACLLSSARTGLCAALALSRLAPVRQKITIIGAGRVGYYAARYAMALGGVEEITFRDVQPDRAAQTASAIGTFCHAEILGAPIKGDVLILATTASEAFCHPPTTEPKVIVSLGADTEDQHELAPAWASAADIYFDGPDCLQVGDLRTWRSAGLIADDNLTSLLDLWRNGPRTSERTRIFISTGSALLDNLTIAYLLEQSSPTQPLRRRESEPQSRS